MPESLNIVIQSTGQHTIVITDIPGPDGGIILKCMKGASIIVNDTGIYIQNGKGTSINMIGSSMNFKNGTLIVKILG